jgi:hypothetical protein
VHLEHLKTPSPLCLSYSCLLFFGAAFVTPAFVVIAPFFAGLFAVFFVAGVVFAGELDFVGGVADLFVVVFFVAAFFVGALDFLTPALVSAVVFVVFFFAAAFVGSLSTVAASSTSLSGAPGSVPSHWRVTRVDVDLLGDEGFGG